MKEEHIKKLTELFKKGETSLKEEADFYKNIEGKGEIYSDLANYVNQEKVVVPENLNEKLWADFEKKISEKKSPKIWKWSIAASILLVIGFYISSAYQQQKEREKQSLLEEARAMFAESKTIEKQNSILYEDETLILYTKKEN